MAFLHFYLPKSLMVKRNLLIVLGCYGGFWRAHSLEHSSQIRGQTMEKAKVRKGLSNLLLSRRKGAEAGNWSPWDWWGVDSHKKIWAKEECERNRTTVGKVLIAKFILFRKEGGYQTFFIGGQLCPEIFLRTKDMCFITWSRIFRCTLGFVCIIDVTNAVRNITHNTDFPRPHHFVHV